MSKARRALLRRAIAQRKRQGTVIPFPLWVLDEAALRARLKSGQVMKVRTREPGCTFTVWVARLDDTLLAATPVGLTDDQAVIDWLAAALPKAARAPKVPSPVKLEPAVVRTRLARCGSCRARVEIPAQEGATAECPRCHRTVS